MPISRWLSERLDDAMIPLLKVISPGYRHRMLPFRPPDACDITSLGCLEAPREVFLTNLADWRGWRVQRFSFPSPALCTFPENRRASGLLITAGTDAPWAVVVPGYATGALPPYGYSLFQSAHGRALLGRQINVALMDPPHHLARKRRGFLSGEGFFSPDLQETQQSLRQGAADLISLVRWLQHLSGQPAAIWGTSLGGCIAGLAATQLPELGALALLEPLDNPGDVLAEVGGAREILSELEQHGVERVDLPRRLAAVAPSSYLPALPLERILFVTPQWDQVVPARFQERFWEAWGRPRRLLLPGSHITLAINGHCINRIADFLNGWLRTPLS